ncbi:MAG TPA: hypothetical protein P5186_00580 [Candidatus Paceibacterota bacterium]|nr:hypothetical protein [Candidatus Paceibacterota bacterium]
MKPFPRTDIVLVITLAILCGIGGFVIGRNPAKIRALQNDVATLQQQLDRAKLQATRPPNPQRPRRQAPATTSPAAPLPTSEESQSQKQWEQWAEAHKRKLNEWWVTNMAADRDEVYTQLYSSLGLDTESIARFKSKLMGLHRKASAAGDPLLELVIARNNYDEEMRSALGDEKYELYRQYEARKPARREYAMLQEYASKHDFQLDPAYASQIVDLMHAAGATTTESWDGPYDPLPSPAAGKNRILEIRSADYSNLQQGWAALKDAAVHANIPDNYRILLQDYYKMKLGQISSELAELQRPWDEVLKEKREESDRLFEEMRLRGELTPSPDSQ